MTRTIDEIKKAKGIRKAVSESKNIAWGGLKQEVVYNSAGQYRIPRIM